MTCPKCKTDNAVIYTEEYRKYIDCKCCGCKELLKGNQYGKTKTNNKQMVFKRLSKKN